MSYRNGYTNGNHGTYRYGDDDGGGRQRRPGGYGGLHDNSLPVPTEQDPPRPRPSVRPRGTEDTNGDFGRFAPGGVDTDQSDASRSRERSVRTQNSSTRHGNGPGGKQIEGQFLPLRLKSTTLQASFP